MLFLKTIKYFLLIENGVDGSTLMCMEYFPSFLPRSFSNEIKMAKFYNDLTGKVLKMNVSIINYEFIKFIKFTKLT